MHDDLPSALVGCELVIGTTARDRHIGWPTLTPRMAATEALGSGRSVAIVFGRERSGLSNAELDLCQRAVRIPTADDFRSLNLAQAVQIMAYELRQTLLSDEAGVAETASVAPAEMPADAAALERLTQHQLAVMTEVGYHDPARPKLLERRLARLFGRAGLLHSEVQILRGFLTAVQAKLGRKAD